MTPEGVGARLVAAVPGAEAHVEFGAVTVTVPRDSFADAARIARDDPQLTCTYFDMLCAVDEGEDGFGVVAHLYDPAHGRHVLLRTVAPRDDPHVPTLTGVFRGSSWHEREAWEMFGVVFDGHPKLTTLLLPDGFDGHPMRKEFVLAARAVKAWPGAKEPGAESSRRPIQPPGQPAPGTGWPEPLHSETKRPDPGGDVT